MKTLFYPALHWRFRLLLLKVNSRQRLPEVLALNACDLKLQIRRNSLARNRSSSLGTTAMNLVYILHQLHSSLRAHRYINHIMICKCGHHSSGSNFLSASRHHCRILQSATVGMWSRWMSSIVRAGLQSVRKSLNLVRYLWNNSVQIDYWRASRHISSNPLEWWWDNLFWVVLLSCQELPGEKFRLLYTFSQIHPLQVFSEAYR